MSVKEDLVAYGIKIARAGLVAGAGGNTTKQQDDLRALGAVQHRIKTMTA